MPIEPTANMPSDPTSPERLFEVEDWDLVFVGGERVSLTLYTEERNDRSAMDPNTHEIQFQFRAYDPPRDLTEVTVVSPLNLLYFSKRKRMTVAQFGAKATAGIEALLKRADAEKKAAAKATTVSLT